MHCRGPGDAAAVPELIGRIVRTAHPDVIVSCPQPIRQYRARLIKDLEKHVELASRLLTPPGAIIIVLDSDGERPGCIAPDLVAKAHAAARHCLVSVNVAHQEFESWFLAAAPAFAGKPGFQATIAGIDNPEGIRGAAERVEKAICDTRAGRYSKAIDQGKLAKLVDLDLAERAPSFRRFRREILRASTLAIDSWREPPPSL